MASLLIVGALTLVLLPSLALASESAAGSPVDATWGQILLALSGRFHIVLVHFPIALLLLAAGLELSARVRRRKEGSPVAQTCAVIGALAAVAATGSGWLNAAQEPPGRAVAELLAWHRWLGVSTAALALVTVIFAFLKRNKPVLRHFYLAGLLINAGLVGWTGHLGGTLVHGGDYYAQVFRPRASTIPSAARPSFTHTAAPDSTELATYTPTAAIFEQRCVKCHGPRRQKGDLRLDDLALTFAGAPEEWVIVPGKPDASELLRRVQLPHDDPDFMPRKDDPLSSEELAVVTKWIGDGAPYPKDRPRSPVHPTPAEGSAAQPTQDPRENATVTAPPAVAVNSGRVPDFDREVFPLLSDRCFTCHGPDAAARKANLRLDTREGILAPLRGGETAVVPGAPEQSMLVERIRSDDPEHRMPPPESHRTLSSDDVDTLVRWIEAGAPWQEHWSFRELPAQVPVPSPAATATATRPTGVRNQIDAFVVDRLTREQLTPSPEAERWQLIRRLSLDLRGLPPTPSELDEFLADTEPDAYESTLR